MAKIVGKLFCIEEVRLKSVLKLALKYLLDESFCLLYVVEPVLNNDVFVSVMLISVVADPITDCATDFVEIIIVFDGRIELKGEELRFKIVLVEYGADKYVLWSFVVTRYVEVVTLGAIKCKELT